jgi:hypothetical protein
VDADIRVAVCPSCARTTLRADGHTSSWAFDTLACLSPSSALALAVKEGKREQKSETRALWSRWMQGRQEAFVLLLIWLADEKERSGEWWSAVEMRYELLSA